MQSAPSLFPSEVAMVMAMPRRLKTPANSNDEGTPYFEKRRMLCLFYDETEVRF
jgi:hypothetical protein